MCRDLRDKDGLRFINSQTFAVPATLPTGASITLDVFLRPTHTAKGVEDFLFVAHADAIASGAKARLMRSPKKPYTDFNLAALHEQLVAQAVDSALVKRFYGHGNTWARVPPQFI